MKTIVVGSDERDRVARLVDRIGNQMSRQFFGVTRVFKPSTLRRRAPKVGRNEPCPCGSGKKYKKCCLR